MRKTFALLAFIIIPFVSHAEIVEVNKTPLYVKKIGRGMPIIMLHGGPGFDHGYLRPQMDDLAIRNQIIYYDQRYCGYSCTTPSKDCLSVQQYVDDLEALRQALNLNRVVLLGHSWGAFLGMHYAIQYPNRVAALILVSSLPASTEGIEAMTKNYSERIKAHQDILTRIKDSKPFTENNPSTMEAYYMMVLSTQVNNPTDAKKINLNFTEDSAKNVTVVAKAMIKEINSKPFDLHESLAKVSAPTLIIHGEKDFIPTSSAKNIQKAIAGARYIEIQDAGHFPYVEKRDETIGYVTEFLTNLELTGSVR